MTSRSLLQVLPIVVVEMVIEYLLERRRNTFHKDIDKHNEPKRILYPLLSAGDVWREAVLVSICDNCEIVFDSARGVFQIYFPAWPSYFSYPGFCNYKLVKRVIVTAPSWKNLCDKNSRETIAWSRYNGAIFPLATNLVVAFKIPYDDPCSLSNFTQDSTRSMMGKHKGAVDFARSLLRLTPAVTGVSVVAISYDATYKLLSGPCPILVSELFQESVTHLDVSCRAGNAIFLLKPDGMSGLTSITHGPGIACLPIARLTYHNARTLRELHITPATQDDWSSLITCGNLPPASYTNLVSLSMDVTNTSPWGWTTVEDAAPFPTLAKLEISGDYPFDDDSLFRGNRGMLQKLSIPFHAIAKNALGGLNALNHRGAMRMNPIYTVLANHEGQIPSTDLVQEQLHWVLESSAVLKLSSETAYRQVTSGPVFTALCTAPSTAIVQHLVLLQQICTLTDIISIVSRLPSLVSLTCLIHGPTTQAELNPESEHPRILRKRDYPLSSNFRALYVYSVINTEVSNVFIIAMQLAVICPCFACVDLPSGLRKELRDNFIWSLENGPFSPYGDDLCRLI
ncbi:hypothetical protein GGI14_002738 [Coemansia sp. S680]|nr:hypothetical protein GGI14_002738 [Coemansia sp. S680]